MFSNADEALKFMKDENVEFVDVRRLVDSWVPSHP